MACSIFRDALFTTESRTDVVHSARSGTVPSAFSVLPDSTSRRSARQPDQRREFHRAVQLHHLRLLTARRKRARAVYVFWAIRSRRAPMSASGTPCDHHPTARDLQVERPVQALATVFHQHVLPGHAERSAAPLHIGRSLPVAISTEHLTKG